MFDLTVGEMIVSDDDLVDSLGENLLDELIEGMDNGYEHIAMETEQQQSRMVNHRNCRATSHYWIIFFNLFLNRNGKFTAGNIDIYEELVEGVLKYVED